MIRYESFYLFQLLLNRLFLVALEDFKVLGGLGDFKILGAL